MHESKFVKVYSTVSLCLMTVVIAPVSGLFMSRPPSTSGVLYVCEGSPVSITCSHNNTDSGVTRWTFSNNSCDSVLISPSDPRNMSCDPFTVHGIRGQPTLISTASATANQSLNGTVVECLDRNGRNPVVIGNTAIVVIDPLTLPMPINLCVSNGFSLISWNVSSTYNEDIILFFAELVESDGQLVSSNYTRNTYFPIEKSRLSPGVCDTASVKSDVIGSCMSAAAVKPFVLPPASGEIDSGKQLEIALSVVVPVLVVVVIGAFTGAIILCYIRRHRRQYHNLELRKCCKRRPLCQINKDNVTMTSCAILPVNIDEVQCTTVGGRVYIQGATEHVDQEFAIYCYNPANDEWKTLPPIPVKYCGLGNYNNFLVAVGGINRNNVVSGDVYTFKNDRWNTTLPKLELARHSSCVLSFSSQLVVAGGKTKSDKVQYTRKVEIYVRDDNKWYNTIPLPKACDISSVIIKNRAFVIGRSDSKLVLFVTIEDLERGKEYGVDDGHKDRDRLSIGGLPAWKIQVETPMELPIAATLGGNLLTVGGRIEGNTTSQIYAYDVNMDNWKHMEGIDLPDQLLGCGICAFSPNEFYVIGGCHDSSSSGDSGDSSYPKVNTIYKFTLSTT